MGLTSNWSADMVARMHVAGVTGKQLAAEAGVSSTYLSEVLNERRGREKTRRKISEALERLEEQTKR